jgi:hypothetical protein
VGSLDASYSGYDNISVSTAPEFAFSIFESGSSTEFSGTFAFTDLTDGSLQTVDATDGYDHAVDINIASLTQALLVNGKDSAEYAAEAAKLWYAVADTADTSVDRVGASGDDTTVEDNYDQTGTAENLFTVTFTPSETLSTGTYVIGMNSKFYLGDSTDAVSDALIDDADDIWLTVDIA